MFDMNGFDFDSQKGMEEAFKTYFTEIAKNKEIINYMIRLTFVSCDYEKKEIVLSVKPEKWMTNPYGIIHGGISATILDTALGVLCRYYARGKMTPSMSLNLSYIDMVWPDKPVYAVAHLSRVGSKVNYGSAYLYSEDPNKHLVEASGTYFVLDD